MDYKQAFFTDVIVRRQNILQISFSKRKNSDYDWDVTGIQERNNYKMVFNLWKISQQMCHIESAICIERQTFWWLKRQVLISFAAIDDRSVHSL